MTRFYYQSLLIAFNNVFLYSNKIRVFHNTFSLQIHIFKEIAGKLILFLCDCQFQHRKKNISVDVFLCSSINFFAPKDVSFQKDKLQTDKAFLFSEKAFQVHFFFLFITSKCMRKKCNKEMIGSLQKMSKCSIKKLELFFYFRFVLKKNFLPLNAPLPSQSPQNHIESLMN